MAFQLSSGGLNKWQSSNYYCSRRQRRPFSYAIWRYSYSDRLMSLSDSKAADKLERIKSVRQFKHK